MPSKDVLCTRNSLRLECGIVVNGNYSKIVSLLSFGIATICMFSLMINDGVEIPIQLSPYRLIPDLPLLSWIALAFVTFGLIIHFSSNTETGETYNLAIAILTILLFYGVLPISESVLRWPDSYMHASFSEYIVQTGQLSPTEIGYHSWPGFYLWFAQLQIVTGIDVLVLAKIAHLIPNILLVLALFILYNKLGLSSRKATLFSIITFIIANDRIYYHISPQNFSFALMATFFYTALVGHRRRFFWVISLTLFFAIVMTHPLNPLYVISPLVFLGLATRIFSVSKQYTSRYFNLSIVAICIWVGWMLYNADMMWWYTGVASISGLGTRLAGERPLLTFAPTYWRWATPPLEIAFLRGIILAVVLIVALIGILYNIRKLGLVSFRRSLKIKRAFDEKSWPFFTFSCFLIAIIIAGVAPFLLYRQLMGFGDRFLLFIWIPLAFFSTSLIFGQRRRKIRILLAVIMMSLLVPAFINTHWHEFWLSTHRWEQNYLGFVNDHSNFSKMFLVNTDTWFRLKAIRGPLETFHGMAEGERYYSLPSRLNIFNGTAAPESLNWTYLIRSMKGEVTLNLHFNIQSEGLQKMDGLLAKNPLISRVYDSEYVQIYYRTPNST